LGTIENQAVVWAPRKREKSMLAEYFPVLIFLVIATALGVVLLATGGILGKLLGEQAPDSEKTSPYECGFEAFEDTRSKFDVRYYLVAILFIIFDLEIAFFIPWALVLDELGVFGLVAMSIFVAELVIGFFFIWKKGALEWE
jgi:NADH-quinone oxidoreductase subunit A